jgi:hypothetical protein
MGGTKDAEEMILAQLRHAEMLGLEVDRLPTGEYIVRHRSGLASTTRLFGRQSLKDFLSGYEFNEDLQGYIIRGTGKWMDPSNE